MPALRLLDLFAGCGGLTQGFKATGRFKPVGAVELDLAAAATYAVNHGKHVFVGDIKEWLKGDIPAADVIVGGPPCQGFSNLGSKDVQDPRNLLWEQYLATLRRVKPVYFVLENVVGFLKSPQFESLQRATRGNGRLKDYAVEPWILNAAHFGVPQARRRAIVIGRLRDLPPLGEPLGELGADRGSWRTVRQAIGDLSPIVDDVLLPEARFEFQDQLLPGPFKTTELHLTRDVSKLSRRRFEAIPPGGNRTNLPDRLLAPCWRGHTTGSGDVMGRLHWDRPSVTIRTEFFKPEKGRYLHPTSHRPITHHEAARLQTFPDDYLWVGSKTSIGRQIGNAVPVGLARAVAQHLLNQMRA
jgi:DNA (cytosine-5)-methyltransferase 1